MVETVVLNNKELLKGLSVHGKNISLLPCALQIRIYLVPTVLFSSCILASEIRKMSTSTLIEVFGHILYSFTSGVTEHYNPDEPEFTTELFGYSPLKSAEREWYCHPVDECIYQEYSDREATSLDYLASCSFDVKVLLTPAQQKKTKKPRKL